MINPGGGWVLAAAASKISNFYFRILSFWR